MTQHDHLHALTVAAQYTLSLPAPEAHFAALVIGASEILLGALTDDQLCELREHRDVSQSRARAIIVELRRLGIGMQHHTGLDVAIEQNRDDLRNLNVLCEMWVDQVRALKGDRPAAHAAAK